MPKFLVEAYAGRISESTCAELAARARAAGAGTSVRYLRSIFVPEDETCFHLFEGASLQAVAEASTRAALAYERIVEAV